MQRTPRGYHEREDLMRVAWIGLLWVAALAIASAQGAPDLASRTNGAALVVVGRVSTVTAQYALTSAGDSVIVSHLAIRVLDVWKGSAGAMVDLEVEGGTVGEIAMAVSDIPRLREGDRAVLFLTPHGAGFRPYRRGLGIVTIQPNGMTAEGLPLTVLRQQIQGH